MKGIKLRGIRIPKTYFRSSIAAFFTGALKPISSESPRASDPRSGPEELTDPYVPYDEQTRIRLQLLDLERHRAEVIDLARRRAYA